MNSQRQRCGGTRKDGSPCTNWAIGTTGYCRHHQNTAQRAITKIPPLTSFLTVQTHAEARCLVETIGARTGGQDSITIEYTLTADEAQALGWDSRGQHLPVPFNDGAFQFGGRNSSEDSWQMFYVLPVAFVIFPEHPTALGISGNNCATLLQPNGDITLLDGTVLCTTLFADLTGKVDNKPSTFEHDAFVAYVRQRQAELVTTTATGDEIAPIRDDISFPTFAELGALRDATYDLARGRLNFYPLEGEVGYAHQRPGARHSVKAVPSPLLSWWGKPLAQDAMEWAVEQFGEKTTDAIKTLYVATGMALTEERGSVLVNLNDFLPKIGLQPRSTEERISMLRDLFAWFTVWDGFSIHGARSGERYIDPRTGQVLDTTIDDPLFRITGRRYGQRSFDGSEPPLAIYITPGAFLQRFRGMRQVLQDFGSLLTLTQIKSGKPSGEWAFCVGSALRQLWRQRAKDMSVPSGEAGTADGGRAMTVTRRQLFALYPPTKNPVEKYLNDPKHAQDARRYWDDARAELQRLHEIGYYRELEELPTEPGRDGKPRLKDGWQEAWMDQPLDIRPAEQFIEAVSEIGQRALEARQAPPRPRRTPEGS